MLTTVTTLALGQRCCIGRLSQVAAAALSARIEDNVAMSPFPPMMFTPRWYQPFPGIQFRCFFRSLVDCFDVTVEVVLSVRQIHLTSRRMGTVGAAPLPPLK